MSSSPSVRLLVGRVARGAALCLALSTGAPLAFGQDEAAADADAPAEDAAQGTAEEQLQARFAAGIELFKNGDYGAAVAAFSDIVTATQGYSPQPLLARAKALAALEEYESALADLKNALTYAQSAPALVPEIQAARGEIYSKLGAYQQALPDFQAAASADRANAQYQFNLGKALSKLGGADAAVKALTRYVDSDLEEKSQLAEALRLRGLSYASLGKAEKSLEDFAASLELDDKHHEAFFGRASLALQQKDYAKASDDLRAAIDSYVPENEEDELPFVQGYLTFAFALEELGKNAEDPAAAKAAFESSLATCDKLLELLPDDGMRAEVESARAATLFRKGVAERLLGDYATAVRSFTKALQLNPGLGEALFRRGVCFFYMGEEELAISDFEQAASINYDSPRSNMWKGLALAKQGNYYEAVRAYGESVAVSDRYVPAFVNRGLAQLQRGEIQKAIDDFNEAIRLQPTEAKHYYRRGMAYSLLGDRERAIQSLITAIEYDQTLKSAYESLSTELEANGQSQLAGEYRRRAAELAATAN
ncbi:MAG: tetratricopeptide repeat protein [Lacipirellulaceae bacterium]